MIEKPEALYLADELEKLLVLGDLGPNGNTAKTIRQLRRLYALCEEMGKALERSDEELGAFAGYHRDGPTRSANAAALAKWKESK